MPIESWIEYISIALHYITLHTYVHIRAYTCIYVHIRTYTYILLATVVFEQRVYTAMVK